MSSKDPFYLVSVPRSGATLLAAMLNSHRHIAMFNEPWFFHMQPKYGTLKRRRNAEMLVGDLIKSAAQFGMILDESFQQEVLQELSRLSSPRSLDVLAIFLERYILYLGKQRWGIKQPFGMMIIPRLFPRFPNMKVIHIIRDPRATATYRMERELGKPENLAQAFYYTRSCSHLISLANDLAQKRPANVFKVRYEDLVQNLEFWLKHICDFLEEEYDPGMMNYPQASNLYVPRGNNGEPLYSHLDVVSSVHTRDVEGWKKILTGREISIVERNCRWVMTQEGYPPLTTGREIGVLKIITISLLFYFRLLKIFIRGKIVEKLFHALRKASIFIFSPALEGKDPL
jgi:protein-tyrosine sulfotransferase